MVTWKDSFEKINTQLEMTTKKKVALENLQNAGRISQFAYECLNKELTDEIEQVEAERKVLAEKMTSKLNELEEQRMALEMFIAVTEMAYAAGEIDDEIHAKESSALDLGLEAVKQELDWIKEVIVQLAPKEPEAPPSATTPIEAAEPATVEVPLERKDEAEPTTQVEVPVEVTPSVSESPVEQIQTPPETPTDAQAVVTEPAEPSEEPFRPQGEETSK